MAMTKDDSVAYLPLCSRLRLRLGLCQRQRIRNRILFAVAFAVAVAVRFLAVVNHTAMFCM